MKERLLSDDPGLAVRGEVVRGEVVGNEEMPSVRLRLLL
jgi:hypothetical protein